LPLTRAGHHGQHRNGDSPMIRTAAEVVALTLFLATVALWVAILA
jgi:hypothetical protein